MEGEQPEAVLCSPDFSPIYIYLATRFSCSASTLSSIVLTSFQYQVQRCLVLCHYLPASMLLSRSHYPQTHQNNRQTLNLLPNPRCLSLLTQTCHPSSGLRYSVMQPTSLVLEVFPMAILSLLNVYPILLGA